MGWRKAETSLTLVPSIVVVKRMNLSLELNQRQFRTERMARNVELQENKIRT
jgi:hypothetical protein